MKRFQSIVAALGVFVLVSCSSGNTNNQSRADYESVAPDKEAAITKFIEDSMPKLGINAAIVKVQLGDGTVIRKAFGESQVGEPATADMRFRNGAIAISYVANLFLQLVDEGKAKLDDKVSTWLPEIPHSDEVTLLQLAQMTSGYQDYVQDPKFVDSFQEDPFRFVTTEQQLKATAKPLNYAPGTNWSYSHTNYVVLGLALEKIGGKPLAELLKEKVLNPLGLSETVANDYSAIPEPALHAYSGERREWFKVPSKMEFLEESTGWTPSWTLGHGSIQTTSIDDVATSASAMGTGKLLSEESARLMLSKDLLGFGKSVDGCATCRKQVPQYTYGVGIVNSGNWLLQNPMFAGYAGIMAYLPSEQVSISIATTLNADGFTEDGASANTAQVLYGEIGAIMAPNDPPPRR